MVRKKGSGRGGYRPGAGRKAADGREMVMRVTACVDQESLDLLESFDPDNMGHALRLVCHELLRLQNPGTVRPPTTKSAEVNAPRAKIKFAGKWVDV